MAERGIIFGAESVRAILAGRKRQTRRVVNPQPESGVMRCHYVKSTWAHKAPADQHGPEGCTCREIRCPYGAPGDLLWVREAWGPCEGGIIYRADESDSAKPDDGRWHSPIHMHRSFSRLTLRVLSVRVERVQEISEEDARAEGCGYSGPAPDAPLSERDLFARLWDSINAKRAPWSSNPWVWCIEFAREPQETPRRTP